MTQCRASCFVFGLMVAAAATAARAEEGRYFKIKVVDDRTGRGVPLVELRTVHQTRYETDSNGLVAFYEPGLMDRKVFFYVRSHGYDYPKDGFGSTGIVLEVREGGSAEIKVTRRNIAERLYRITGAGIYRDSVLLGVPTPIRRPLLNGQVCGQDSTMAAVWRDRIWWFWGDTNRPLYPLGLFQTSGATSSLPGHGGLDPAVGIDLDYFVDRDGFSKAMVPIAGPGAVWIEGLMAVPDAGQERLAARYMRMRDLGDMLEHGLIVFDESEQVFKKRVELDLKERWRFPKGHPILYQDGGTAYFLFPLPYVATRVKAELKCVLDPACYEAFTCLKSGSQFQNGDSRLDRTADGRLRYAWKSDTAPLSADEERELIQAGKIQSDEAHCQPRDVETRKPVEMHLGSIRWNAFRKKWILIAVEKDGGPSFLGEIWYSEADAPTGPWRWAKRIVTHDKYTFYNPVHHDFLDQQGGRILYFEGTYATTFSGNPTPTPRYDYNQIMYRLDLADPRLPQPLAPK